MTSKGTHGVTTRTATATPSRKTSFDIEDDEKTKANSATKTAPRTKVVKGYPPSSNYK